MGAVRSERGLVLDQSDRKVSALTIREANTDDVADLQRLACQLGYEPSIADVEATVASLNRGAHTVLVACQSDRILGWIELQRFGLLTSGEEAHISGLVVEESARGGGIGRKLVEASESWARDRGLKAIRVRSRDSRARAHKFYGDLGYEEVKRQVVFRKNLR